MVTSVRRIKLPALERFCTEFSVILAAVNIAILLDRFWLFFCEGSNSAIVFGALLCVSLLHHG